jgi:GR25 family glycosyltransferase involved in LPS biosynthesis
MGDIDKIYYINLDHREDRKNNLLKWIEASGFPLEKVERISATYIPGRGHIGCGISHVNALEAFLKTSHSNCLILEDDYEPLTISTFWSNFDKIFKDKIKFYIVMGAFNHNDLKSSKGPADYLLKIDFSYTTSAYLITREFAPILVDCFKDAVRYAIHEESITKQKTHKYTIDVHWCTLMPLHRWYAFAPRIGRQIASYSDIEGVYCNHGV